ncbi:arrestin domain-containing protein 3 isoform X1 [Zeugodacus cucurbitae]|uniref:arrestin domain-containing protein 3 isoform X1 n=1 Tax=Zeugodacus cucurbitae TaxID=28588 RepID=UPI0023D93D96|nr:arrestin domain-containing protein 3 isoform X1 [Zeugodacus cucurbitae]
MPTMCSFQLDRMDVVYNSGEYIHGRIVLKTEKMKRVNAVYVTLEGEARVQWSLSGKSDSANYCGHQQYLYTRTNVFDSTEFRAGTHVYVLRLRIPSGCPSSCKGPYGFIAYNISLTIAKPWTFDEVFRKPITVVQALNLNHNPEYGLPIRDENVKYLCNWPCTSGPIMYTLLLPYNGFVARQQITFFLEVDNQSPHYDISSIEASLKQHFIFLARQPYKRNFYTKTLAKSIITERTLRLSKRMYQGTVCVPSDTPRSTLNPNYIVFVHYTLQVKLKTGYFHYDTDLSVPVVIGTIPLQQRGVQLVTTQPRRISTRDISTLEEEDGDVAGEQWSVQAEINQTEEDGEGDDDDDDDDFIQPVASSHATPRRTRAQDISNNNEEDEPPSYDSCLPPSFSFATLSSQQTLDSVGHSSDTKSRGQRTIKLPKFPGYDIVASSTQAINMSADSAFSLNYYRSYGSLGTGHTGRSLDTFASSCGVLSETDEHVHDANEGDDDDDEDIF